MAPTGRHPGAYLARSRGLFARLARRDTDHLHGSADFACDAVSDLSRAAVVQSPFRAHWGRRCVVPAGPPCDARNGARRRSVCRRASLRSRLRRRDRGAAGARASRTRRIGRSAPARPRLRVSHQGRSRHCHRSRPHRAGHHRRGSGTAAAPRCEPGVAGSRRVSTDILPSPSIRCGSSNCSCSSRRSGALGETRVDGPRIRRSARCPPELRQ